MQLYGTRARYSGALQRSHSLRAPAASTPQRRGGTFAIIAEASGIDAQAPSRDVFKISGSTAEISRAQASMYEQDLRRYLGSLSVMSHTDDARLNAILREVTQTLDAVKALRSHTQGLPPVAVF